MKKIAAYITSLFVLVSISCDDGFLDRTPHDGLSSAVIWNSDTNAEMAINGMYRSFAQESWYTPYYYTTTLAPEGYTIVRGNDGVNHMTGNATPNDPRIREIYTRFYKTIRYANDAISGLANNDMVTPDVATRMLGEAKFFRGLSYFYLWQYFGGVPIIDGRIPVSESYMPRSTADQVKDFIIADFTEAGEKLPVNYASSAQSGKVERGAAIAMLGKVLLYDEQWGAAAEQFAKLLTAPFTYDLTENFDDHFYYQTQMNEESVFEVQYMSEQGLGSDIDTRFGYRNHPRIGQDYATASDVSLEIFTNKDGTSIDRSTIPNRNDYANEASFGADLTNWYQTTYADADPRLHMSVILPGSTIVGALNVVHKLYWPTGTNAMSPPGIRTTWPNEAMIPIRKFVSPGEDAPLRRNSPVNFPLIRFADVLLMYAEAKNEAEGPSTEAFQAINRVRARAGVAHIPNTLSQPELRREIRLERLRELLFESHSYLDARRWRLAHLTEAEDPIFALNHVVRDFKNNPIITKVFSENRDYLWPIPAQEIDLNPVLEQNPNY